MARFKEGETSWLNYPKESKASEVVCTISRNISNSDIDSSFSARRSMENPNSCTQYPRNISTTAEPSRRPRASKIHQQPRRLAPLPAAAPLPHPLKVFIAAEVAVVVVTMTVLLVVHVENQLRPLLAHELRVLPERVLLPLGDPAFYEDEFGILVVLVNLFRPLQAPGDGVENVPHQGCTQCQRCAASQRTGVSAPYGCECVLASRFWAPGSSCSS